MSLLRHVEDSPAPIGPPRFGRKPVRRPVLGIGHARRMIMKAASLFARAVQAIAEARMHRLAIETELYLNRYRHTSKNDDDLPVVRRIR